MKIQDARGESMSPADMAQLQLERLQALIVRVRRNVRRYRETLGEARVTTLSDVQQLPVTTPDDLFPCARSSGCTPPSARTAGRS